MSYGKIWIAPSSHFIFLILDLSPTALLQKKIGYFQLRLHIFEDFPISARTRYFSANFVAVAIVIHECPEFSGRIDPMSKPGNERMTSVFEEIIH
jgi:hypothetical protein